MPAKSFSSDCMRWEWFKNKELGFLLIWSQGTLSVVFSPANNCFSGKKGRVLFIASWQVMKNGFIIATQKKENHGDCPVMLLRRRLGRIFTLRRLCCVFGGTRSVLFIMSCWNRTKASLGNGIGSNWCVWAEHCAKNGHNTSRNTKKWFYSMITLGLALPNPLKHTWKRSNGKSCPTRRIPQSVYYLFWSMGHDLSDQQFRSYEDIKKWLDSWIASKDEHFYRNGIRAVPKRWAKVVANDGKYFEWFICNHFSTIKLHFY